MEDRRNHARRRTWINAGFQARYTALVVGVATAILVALGALYLRVLSEEQRLIGLACPAALAGSGQSQADSAAQFDAELKGEFAGADARTSLIIAGIAAVLVALLAFASIRMTFRATGPVYAVSRMIRMIAEGDLFGVRPLRRGDEFRFLEDDMFSLRESIAREAKADAELMRRCSEALSGDVAPLQAELEECIARKQGRAVALGACCG